MAVRMTELYVKLIEGGEETSEISRLALTTGSEVDEVHEIMNSDKVFLVKRKGKIMGFIALKARKKAKTMEVSGLAVKEQERRKGIAGLLIKHAEGFARNADIEKLVVRTSNDNIPALALYQKEGFRIRKVKPGVLVGHHGGKEIAGWEGIPIRDVIILEKSL